MTSRAAIQQLGRMIRDDLQSGELSAGANSVGDVLVEQPQAVLLIVDVTAAEARKRRPDERICQAYAVMLGQTLERLRQRAEAGQAFGAIVIDQVRSAIAHQLTEGTLAPRAAMLLAAAFTRNGIDLGNGLRNARDSAMAQRGGERANEASPDPTSMLTALADACDHDPFMIHTELAAMIAATPVELQLTLLNALVEADAPDLREAAIGWLLAEPALASPLVWRIEAAAKQGLVSPLSVAHLMIMRNLVPEGRRPGIDAIIKAARVHGPPQSRCTLASNSNVQSWFENGDEVAAARKSKRKKNDRIAAIIGDVLEPRRAFWAEVIAWSAFARRGGGDDSNWLDKALVARELAGDRPLAELPLATFIAVQTDAAAPA